MHPKVIRIRVSTFDTRIPTTGIMHMIRAPPGDSAIPANCAVYPSNCCSSCGISTVLEYSTNPRKNIATVAIAKLRSFNILKSTTGSFSRNSHRIPAIIPTSISAKKTTMNLDENQSSRCPLSRLISLGLGSMQIILDKGQREDWFSSRFIVVFFALMLVGIIAGILWELREKEPVVDLRMLKDRNFAIATVAMFFLGFVLYSSTVLIPQLLQQLLGYTAQLAGIALSPGGARIMCMMPVVGILVSRVDTRILITFGFIVAASELVVIAGGGVGLDYQDTG